MGPIRWGAATRVTALLVTAFFFAATVLQALLEFDVLGEPPVGGIDFVDEVLAGFAWEQERWPVEFAATVLFAAGFASLAGLGLLLARLAPSDDARRPLIQAAYLGAGGIGVASQLLWLGVKPVASSPELCECGLRTEEVMSRVMILNVAENVQLWMAIGAVVLAAIGALLVAPLGRRAGMPSGWFWIAMAIAVLGPLAGMLAVLGAAPFDAIVLILVAGIALPGWALWLAIRSESLSFLDA